MSSTQQFFILGGAFVGGTIILAVVGVLILKKLDQLSGTITPFWARVVRELSSIMHHSSQVAANEQDRYMIRMIGELEENPDLPMDPAEFDRLLQLVAERANSEADWLRPGERKAAAIYLLAVGFAREEALSKVKLTGVQLVGSIATKDGGKPNEKDLDTSDPSCAA